MTRRIKKSAFMWKKIFLVIMSLTAIFMSSCQGMSTEDTVEEATIVPIEAYEASSEEKRMDNKETTDTGKAIPDLYNTGVNNINVEKEELMIPDFSRGKYHQMSDGFIVRTSSSGMMINLKKDRNNVGMTVKNVDFSSAILEDDCEWRLSAKYASEKQEGEITFVNCVFPYMTFANKTLHKIRWNFEHCTFLSGSAISNARFVDCQFGSFHGGCDVQCDYNTTFEHCYFWYANDYVGGYSSHVDGIQVSGIENYLAGNILIENCNFQIPIIKTGAESGVMGQDQVNSCIMIQPDYGPVRNIKIKNCFINGGGYSVYMFPKNWDIENASVENSLFGWSRRYEDLYPTKPDQFVWEGNDHLGYLMVGSIWKEGKSINISVTNDIPEERTLRVETNLGEAGIFKIPPCPVYEEQTMEMKYKDYPFNLKKEIKAKDVKWVKCYDTDLLIGSIEF